LPLDKMRHIDKSKLDFNSFKLSIQNMVVDVCTLVRFKNDV